MKQIDIAMLQIQNIEMLYRRGHSVWDIGKKLQLPGQTIHKAMVRAGIPRRDKSHSIRKHSINEDYFIEIDNHEKAYWLGMLFSDGALVKRKGCYTIGLTLKSEDKYHLQNFLNSVGSSHVITDRKDKPASQFVIGNKKLCSDLMGYGLTERKSFTIQYPIGMSEEYDNSFILGYFDGNGSLYSRERKRYIRKQTTFSIIGSYNIIVAIAEKVKLYTKVNYVKITKHSLSNVYMFRIEGINNLKSLMGWLYKDCPVFLSRKRKIYENNIVNY